jgi:GGDEF domain-containing protein
MSNYLCRTAASAALIALAVGAPAHAVTVTVSPGGVSAQEIGQSGVTLDVDPQKGANAGVDAGGSLGVDAGVGPNGAQVNLNPNAVTLPGGTPTTPSTQGPSTGSGAGAGSGSGNNPGNGSGSQPSTPTGTPSTAAPAGPNGETGTGGGAVSGSGTDASGTNGSRNTDTAGSADRRVDAKPAADRGPRGVAPVLDLIERIPPALWAAIAALGAIALGLWLMWVRGRRRLERNAWVDADNGEMNIVAFETLLAQEWARSERYRRPLGLLLLELEESTPAGGRRPIAGRRIDDARAAIIEQSRDADIAAQLSPSRFAVICPESSPGSVETLARALEHSLEGRQVHARVGMGARYETDRGPADLVSRAAVGLDEPPTWAGPVIGPEIAAAESYAVTA